MDNLEKIVGKIKEKKETIRALFKQNITTYTISNEERDVLCAFFGHYEDSPKEGDLVEFYLADNTCAFREYAERKKTEDGYFEFEKIDKEYLEIKKYKILESSD